jgi:RNA polymerase sigma-70 factor, ECF subfamily
VTNSTATALFSLRLNEGKPLAKTSAHNAGADGAVASTADLTRRLAAGDEEAFRQFHAAYFNRLYRFLLLVCHGREDAAQDALQETLARLVRYARVFEDEDVFWSWLKALARSAAADGHRKQRRHLALLQKFSLRLELDAPPTPRESEDGLRDVLRESLDELSLDDRRLIEGKYIAGESVRELAADTQLSEKSVESRLHRLRRGLRERILEKLRRP